MSEELRLQKVKSSSFLVIQGSLENQEEEEEHGITVGEFDGDDKVKGEFAKEEEETLHQNG